MGISTSSDQRHSSQTIYLIDSPERNVTLHSERHGIHKLRGVRNEREESESEELLINL